MIKYATPRFFNLEEIRMITYYSASVPVTLIHKNVICHKNNFAFAFNTRNCTTKFVYISSM